MIPAPSLTAETAEQTSSVSAISIWITTGMRLSVSQKREYTVARIISITPGASRSGSISSRRYQARTDCIHAAIDALLEHGGDLVERAYQQLGLAHERWRDGRKGVRPRAGASRLAMVAAAEQVTALAIDFAHAYRELKNKDHTPRCVGGLPDWVECALEDLARGSSKEQSAKSLIRSLMT